MERTYPNGHQGKRELLASYFKLSFASRWWAGQAVTGMGRANPLSRPQGSFWSENQVIQTNTSLRLLTPGCMPSAFHWTSALPWAILVFNLSFCWGLVGLELHLWTGRFLPSCLPPSHHLGVAEWQARTLWTCLFSKESRVLLLPCDPGQGTQFSRENPLVQTVWVAWGDSELRILLPKSPESWGYRHAAPHPASLFKLPW